MNLYPLKFAPLFVEKMWGGRKIENVLGKALPPGKRIGESWELYDFPPGVVGGSGDWVSSAIANGPLAGRTLHWAVHHFGKALLGSVQPVGPHEQFPLLIKFLDAREDLSVQVHPDQQYADAHPDAHLKTEAWYIVEHDPGARLFKGLRAGSTCERFRAAVEAGDVERYLTSIPVSAGQCHYLPSGTVHALGAGILAAEVQTPSDTTFRVFDFNRTDPATGKPRSLHIEQAMECIDFSAEAPRLEPAPGRDSTRQPLVSSPYFRIEKRLAARGETCRFSQGQPAVLILLKGQALIASAGAADATHLAAGETLLLPAEISAATMETSEACEWLEVGFATR